MSWMVAGKAVDKGEWHRENETEVPSFLHCYMTWGNWSCLWFSLYLKFTHSTLGCLPHLHLMPFPISPKQFLSYLYKLWQIYLPSLIVVFLIFSLDQSASVQCLLPVKCCPTLTVDTARLDFSDLEKIKVCKCRNSTTGTWLFSKKSSEWWGKMTTGWLTVAMVPHTRKLGLYLRRLEPTEGS